MYDRGVEVTNKRPTVQRAICVAVLLCAAFAGAALAQKPSEEKPAPKPAKKEGLVVVSPGGFWFKFPDKKEEKPAGKEKEKATDKAEAAAAAKKAAEEKARKEKDAEAAAAKKAAEEKARKEKDAEAAAAKKAAEEEARKEKDAEAAAAKKAAEEEARKEKDAEAAAKKKTQEPGPQAGESIEKLFQPEAQLHVREKDVVEMIVRRGPVSVQLQRMKAGWQALMKSSKGEIIEGVDTKVADALVSAISKLTIERTVPAGAFAIEDASASLYFRTKDDADCVLGLFKKDRKTVLAASGGDGVLVFTADSLPALLTPFETLLRNAQDSLSLALPDEAQVPASQESVFHDVAFVWIPQGTFDMGSSLSGDDVALIYGGDAQQYRDEQPCHAVTLTKGFWMGKYEVTNAQFGAFVSATSHQTDAERAGTGRIWNGADWEDLPGASWRVPGWEPAADLPVVLVSWNDAAAYADWLSASGDGKYRLPTEAEWEYACRAGNPGAFFCGNDPSVLGDHARYRANAMAAGEPYPARAGSKKPNAWGLYDMHGNVSEWCSDWYREDYYAHAPASDPRGPGAGEYRSLRGGSWYSLPRFFRCASRTRSVPGYRNFVLGFRVCRDE